MARSIEEKVVKLSLDDKDLVSRAEKSIGVFGKLKQAFSKADTLSTKKSQQALSDLDSSTKSLGMDALQAAVEGVSNKFSVMGVVAATAISNITSKVMSLASTMANKAFFQPMKDGFAEYELKLGSIQTILANTARHGTTIDDVTKSLDELNVYADKTIYNFADMTKNIGLFTNAGIKVEDATGMIKGLSNEAAVSGSTAAQAANAAYQLSQALSTGVIKAQDWMSITNAGMGNKTMQEGLQAVARATGELNEKTGEATLRTGSFKDSLTDGWLTAGVMQKYLMIQAGEMNKEQMMSIGLSAEQADAFIKQAKTAEEAATKIRTFSQLVDTVQEEMGSGWVETWELIFGGFNEATELWSGLHDKLGPMMDKSANDRNKFIKDLMELGAKTTVITTLTNAFKFLGQIITAVKGGFEKVFPPKTAADVYKIIQAIQQFVKELVLTQDEVGRLTTVFQGVFSVFSIAIKVIKMIGNAFMKMIPDNLGGKIFDLLETVANLIIEFDKGLTPTNAFTKILDTLASTVKTALTAILNFGGSLRGLFKFLPSAGKMLMNTFGKVGDFLGQIFEGFNATDLLNGGFLVALTVFIKKISGTFDKFGGIGDSIKGLFDNFGEAIENLGGLKDALDSMQQAINVASILAIAGAVFMLALSMNMISKIKAQDIFKALETLGLALAGVMGALWFISKKNMTGSLKAAVTITAVAGALLVIAGALKILSTIDPERMGSALLGLAVSLGVMVTALNVMSKINGKTLANSISIGILAASIVVLAGAVYILGSIDAGKAKQGVMALGAILLELSIFLALTTKSKLNMGTAMALAVISGAIMAMCGAIYVLGTMDTGALQQGLLAIGAVLLGFTIFTKLIGNSGSFMMTAMSLTILAGALTIMIVPLKQMGNMSMDQLSTSLLMLAGSLFVIIGALHLAKGTIGGAVALGIAAASIALFVPPMMMLSKLSLAEIGKSLLAIGGTFAIVAAAALLMGPASLALIPFALAIGAVGLAAIGIGAAMMGIATSLTLLASLSVTAIASIVGSLALLIAGLITLVPQLIELGVAIMMGLIQGLGQVAPALITTATNIIVSLLAALVTLVPAFIETGVSIIMAIMDGFNQHAPELLEAGVQMMITFLDGLADTIENNQERFIGAILALIGSVLQLLVTALEQIVTLMFGWIPGVEGAAAKVGDAARKGIHDKFNANTARQDADAATGSFTSGVDSATGKANQAGANVAGGAQQGMGSKDATGEGSKLGDTMSSGISGTWGDVNSAAERVAQGGKQGFGSVDANDTGGFFGEGFANGISSKKGLVQSAAEGLASAGKWALEKVLAIFSPSRVMRKDGGFFGDGFIFGIKDKYSDTKQAAKQMGQHAIDATTQVLDNEAQKLLDLIDLAPIIKPVLDLSNITKASIGSMSAILDSNRPQLATEGGDNYTINNQGLLEGAIFNVREEADIKKLAKEVDNVQKQAIIKKGGKVVSK